MKYHQLRDLIIHYGDSSGSHSWEHYMYSPNAFGTIYLGGRCSTLPTVATAESGNQHFLYRPTKRNVTEMQERQFSFYSGEQIHDEVNATSHK